MMSGAQQKKRIRDTRTVSEHGGSYSGGIPKDIADELGIEPGDRLLWEYNRETGEARVWPADEVEVGR